MRLQSHYIQSTIKHRDGSLIVWGCISVYGIGNLARIDSTMNTELYCRILEENLAPNVEFYEGKLSDFIL